jgi:hypothetical protein
MRRYRTFRNTPPKIVRFARLDGYGEDAIDLDLCRRFLVGVPAFPGAHHLEQTTVRVYYVALGDRVIMGLGGLNQLRRGDEGYMEIHPLQFVHDLQLCGINIPPEFDRYRPFLRPDVSLLESISAWEKSLASTTQEAAESTPEALAELPGQHAPIGFHTRTVQEQLEETLELIPRSPNTENLTKFLLSCETKRATLNQVCNHIYKSVDKTSLANASRLINRVIYTLESENAPLRIGHDKKYREIRIIIN